MRADAQLWANITRYKMIEKKSLTSDQAVRTINVLSVNGVLAGAGFVILYVTLRFDLLCV